MSAYYNEIDPFAAAWLRELIREGLIADGEVDERSITDVQPADLDGFSQCHFFAGIGGWSYALRLAVWDDARPVWTGSCPCQPFSAAGKREGGADDRHLWPHWARLISECRPSTVFGEQVESAIAHGWLDTVFDDLEREGYACGAACLPAASVGAPHIRQRVWFVAESSRAERGQGWAECDRANGRRAHTESSGPSHTGGVAESDGGHTEHREIQRGRQHGLRAEGGRVDGPAGDTERAESRVADHTRDGRREERQDHRRGGSGDGAKGRPAGLESSGDLSSSGWLEADDSVSPWTSCDWLPCRDGKGRPVEPGTFPLAHGVSARVGRLRGYGNAIVPQVAAEVIRAYMEAA